MGGIKGRKQQARLQRRQRDHDNGGTPGRKGGSTPVGGRKRPGSNKK